MSPTNGIAKKTSAVSARMRGALELQAAGFEVFPLHSPANAGCSCRKGASCSNVGQASEDAQRVSRRIERPQASAALVDALAQRQHRPLHRRRPGRPGPRHRGGRPVRRPEGCQAHARSAPRRGGISTSRAALRLELDCCPAWTSAARAATSSRPQASTPPATSMSGSATPTRKSHRYPHGSSKPSSRPAETR